MKPVLSGKIIGPLLVTIAGLLWGTDSVFRYKIADSVDSVFVVFIEHALAVPLLFPWVLLRDRNEFLKLNSKEWGAAIFAGCGGSAIAMVFFTLSFKYVNPSVAVLLQKIQPVIVVAIAYVILGERPKKTFYPWAIVALGAAIVLSFPDFDFNFQSVEKTNHAKGLLYSFMTALLWAGSTVAGKLLLKRHSFRTGAFWRYSLGLLTLTVILVLQKTPTPWHTLASGPTQIPLLYLSLAAGVLPMLFYYAGLAQTTATITTFVELLFPVSAVILNTIFLHTPLQTVQLAAGAILLFSITRISKS